MRARSALEREALGEDFRGQRVLHRSHMVWPYIDPVAFRWDFPYRIYHVHCKDPKKRLGNGSNGANGRDGAR